MSASPKRPLWKPLRVALPLALAIWCLNPLMRVDRAVTDLLLARGQVAASDKYVFVRMTQEDLVRLEHVSAQRSAIAQVVDSARVGGAQRLLLDFVFSGEEANQGDRDLQGAIRRFGEDRVAIASNNRQDLPRPRGFYQDAIQVEGALAPDRDGRFRSVARPAGARFANAALWLSSGKIAVESTPLDLSIAPGSVRTVSLDAARNPAAVAQFKDKVVIVSLTRVASRARVAMPVYGLTDRGPFFAVAAQSVDRGASGSKAIAGWTSAGLALACVAAGLWLGAFLRTARTVTASCLAASGVAMASGLAATAIVGQAVYPMALALILIGSLLTAVALRLQLNELVKTFLAGDLSPEEAWAWRSQAQVDQPVLLLGVGGVIKRANAEAVRAFGLTRAPRAWIGPEVSRYCMSSLAHGGLRGVQKDFGGTTWRLEWLSGDMALAIFRDVTDQTVLVDDLERKLVTDPLTGVRNRLGFDRALAEVRLGAGEKCGVFFLDLNGFKQINDTHGHAVGDELLRVVAKRFSSVTRSQDVLARLGGDEFAILTRGDITSLKAVRTVDNLEACLDEVVRLNGLAVKVGVAVGFSLSTEEDTDIMAVVHRADHDMYERKRIQKLSPRPDTDHFVYQASADHMRA